MSSPEEHLANKLTDLVLECLESGMSADDVTEIVDQAVTASEDVDGELGSIARAPQQRMH